MTERTPHRRDSDLIEYRVGQLEEAHKTLADAMANVVFEIRSGKRMAVLALALVGMAQPFLIHYLTRG